MINFLMVLIAQINYFNRTLINASIDRSSLCCRLPSVNESNTSDSKQ